MKYESYVKLGEKYKDERSGTEGYAVSNSIFQHGCERVSLEHVDSGGSLLVTTFDAPRLSDDPVTTVHDSKIVLGEEYEDRNTGIRGIASSLTFHENANENVTLDYRDKNGCGAEVYLDVAQVKPVSRRAKEAAEETEERQERTGGPARTMSHVRPGPNTRR